MPDTPQNLNEPRWLRSLPTASFAAAGAIDAEQGIIPDVIMAREGEARGHGFNLDSEFITELVAYDKRYFSKIGLKSRFGHPSASEETMGKQLGVFNNFRTREGADGKMEAIANLQLLDSAENSPTHPGMRSWVLQMAAERPDFIMSSIVFQPAYFYQRRENGRKHKLEPNPNAWMDGQRWLNFQEELGPIFCALQDHYFTDLVEQGAVTDALLSNTTNPHFFVSQAGQFLADHPELKQFAQAHPDKVQAFLAELGVNLQPTKKQTLKMSLKELLFGTSKPADDTTLSAEDVQELRTSLAKAEAAMATATADLATAKQEITALQSGLAETETHLEKAKARIVELEAKAAAVHTQGQTETETGAQDDKPYFKSSVTARALAMHEERKA